MNIKVSEILGKMITSNYRSIIIRICFGNIFKKLAKIHESTIFYQVCFRNILANLFKNSIGLGIFDFRLLSLYIREVDIFYILSFSFNEKQGIRNRKKGERGGTTGSSRNPVPI